MPRWDRRKTGRRADGSAEAVLILLGVRVFLEAKVRCSRDVGIHARRPTPSWGNILADGYAFNSPWLVIAGGVPLILTTLGFTFLGEALRDIFDPRLRRTF